MLQVADVANTDKTININKYAIVCGVHIAIQYSDALVSCI